MEEPPQDSRVNEREEFEIEDMEIVKSFVENKDNSSSFISRVSNSLDEVEKKSNSKGRELFWDFLESIDRRDSVVIQTITWIIWRTLKGLFAI